MGFGLRGLACCMVVFGAATVSGEALAEYPATSPYLGLYGGATVPLGDWDLGDRKVPSTANLPKTSGTFGLRPGVQLTKQFGLEGEFAYLPLRTTTGSGQGAFAYSLQALYHFTDANWTPYVMGGAGVYHSVSSKLGKDVDPRAHLGLGVRGLVSKSVAARFEVRDSVTDGLDGITNNLELTLGLDLFPGQGEPEVLDRDKDGVEDARDACPTEAGTAKTNGCPDADDDGVVDAKDKCPKQAGPEAMGGCPDVDQDGIADPDDACPLQPGKVALMGCADSDDDGISDATDKCPQDKGTAAFEGCPDSDGDGLADASDLCPKVAGPKESKGCPDRDKDGVIDPEDKCPDQAGLKEHQGCVPEAMKKFTGAIKGINFQTGSAQILPGSFKLLDDAVKVLKEFPKLRMRIEGHTDNVGKAEKNLKLSQDRADSVKKYMVTKGIEEKRIETKGYGQDKPVQDNKTEAGKAANRRIEFTPLGE